jgi:hypothetical protein
MINMDTVSTSPPGKPQHESRRLLQHMRHLDLAAGISPPLEHLHAPYGPLHPELWQLHCVIDGHTALQHCSCQHRALALDREAVVNGKEQWRRGLACYRPRSADQQLLELFNAQGWGSSVGF